MTEQQAETKTEKAASPEGSTGQKPAADGGAQGSELDKLLSEFEESEAKPKGEAAGGEAKKEEKKDDDISEVRAWIKQQEARNARQELTGLASGMKKDHPGLSHLSEKRIVDLLEIEASNDKRIATAWLKRDQFPETWAQVVKTLGKKLEGEFSRAPDPQLTADRDAARAAVSGRSTSAPSEERIKSGQGFGDMSDAEWAAYERKHLKRA